MIDREKEMSKNVSKRLRFAGIFAIAAIVLMVLAFIIQMTG